MNVRFAEGSVRCRVTPAEIDALVRSGTLVLAVSLPGHHRFQVTVRAAALEQWQLDSDPTGFWISIPRSQILQLSQTLPSREGITHMFQLDAAKQLQLGFEVDVRRRPPHQRSEEPAGEVKAS